MRFAEIVRQEFSINSQLLTQLSVVFKKKDGVCHFLLGMLCTYALISLAKKFLWKKINL